MEDIVQQLAKEFDLPIMQTRAIQESVFRFIAQEMRKKEFKTFFMVNFGRFTVKNYGEDKYKDAIRKRTFKKIKKLIQKVEQDERADRETWREQGIQIQETQGDF